MGGNEDAEADHGTGRGGDAVIVGDDAVGPEDAVAVFVDTVAENFVAVVELDEEERIVLATGQTPACFQRDIGYAAVEEGSHAGLELPAAVGGLIGG